MLIRLVSILAGRFQGFNFGLGVAPPLGPAGAVHEYACQPGQVYAAESDSGPIVSRCDKVDAAANSQQGYDKAKDYPKVATLGIRRDDHSRRFKGGPFLIMAMGLFIFRLSQYAICGPWQNLVISAVRFWGRERGLPSF